MWTWLSAFLMNPSGFVPVGAALNWRPDLIWLHAFGNGVMGLGLCLFAGFILLMLHRREDLAFGHRLGVELFCTFLLANGLNHFIDIYVLWHPAYLLQGVVKAATALLSVVTALVAMRLLPRMLRLPNPGELAALNAQLQQEVKAKNAANDALGEHQRLLEQTVADRTFELSTIQDRFQTALRGASVLVVNQDRDLRYTWMSGPTPFGNEERYLNHSDYDLMQGSNGGSIIALKEKVLASGRAQENDVAYEWNDQTFWFRLNATPVLDRKGDVTGLNCVAVDITLMKALEQEQIRLSAELAASLQRYQLALRSSKVIVFTQDAQLIYQSISAPMLGIAPEAYIGRDDDGVLPAAVCNVMVPIKKRVLATGQPEQTEVPVSMPDWNDGRPVWLNLFINPLQDVSGRTIGLTCAALDVTERKGWEEHLRLLMREVTHRSKNLLAVIQAMARQTARNATSVPQFIDHFSARLQALGGAHDLLVKESWHGVNMHELIRSQLGHYADLQGTQVTLDGPDVFMTPEAAQNLGMALHEMATNAAKYGALTLPQGQVGIGWQWQDQQDEQALVLHWDESGGPPARKPERAGFGTHVIERNLVRSLSAQVQLSYGESGFSAVLTIPAHSLLIKSTMSTNLPKPATV